MSSLKEYAHFLKENYLEALAQAQLAYIKKMDIPIMKLLGNLPDEKLIETSKVSLLRLLDSFIDDTAIHFFKEGMQRWQEDRLEGGVKREQIQPSDLLLLYTAQQKALDQFIPSFTPDSRKAIDLAMEISDIYIQFQESAFEVLFRLRKMIEEQLAESVERFRSVSQMALDAIIVTDDKQHIIFWNKAAQGIFLYNEEEIIGKSFDALFNKENRIRYWAEIEANKLKDDEAVQTSVKDICMLRKDRRELPVDMSAASWVTRSGRIYSYILHDLSERKKIEEEVEKKNHDLESSNAELEQFAYIASHDLKEPLRMVSNYTMLLQRKYGDKLDDAAREYIHFAVDGVMRMGELINDLLNYSRVNSSEQHLVLTDMNDVLAQALKNLADIVREKDVQITSEALPLVMADPVQMLQLFQNLIGNALKFNTSQPVIRIGAEKKKKVYQFCIIDNGIGINPAYRDRIFVMFQRLHSRSEYPGTGIGLAICKKIVERHGGKIWVESSENTGSTFFFTIPA